MAVIKEPKVLLLDEHTAALDPKSAAQVTKLTQAFIGRGRLTTLMVTHSMQQALDLGTRTVMIHRGQIIVDRVLQPQFFLIHRHISFTTDISFMRLIP